MPVVVLTPALIRDAQCPPGKTKVDYYDVHLKSFLVEVRPGGKSFYLRYRDAHGTLKQKKLGDASVLSLAEARKLATKLKAQIQVNGHDPVQTQQTVRSIPTFETLVREHVLPYVQQHKRSWTSDRSHLEHHLLPAFGKLHLDTVKSPAIMAWIKEKEAAGYAPATLNRMLGLLSWIYKQGAAWGIPGCDHNPAQAVPLFRVNNHREVFLTEGQIAKLMQALDESPNRELKPFVALSILLGTRKNELVRAEWSDVDLERKLFRVPPERSKNGKERLIPLSQTALAILEGLPRNSTWLLPNPQTGKPYVSFYHAWDTARHQAGVPQCRWHDLRHTAASLMASQGVSLYTIGKVLGHAQAKTTQRYAHLTDEALRQAMETVSVASGL